VAKRTVGRDQKVSIVLAPAPLDLVDLLLDLQALEVVKLGLVALEFCPEFVLAPFFLSTRKKQYIFIRPTDCQRRN